MGYCLSGGSIDHERMAALKDGYYGWPVLSPEYERMEKDNAELCATYAAKVREFTNHYSFVQAPYSRGEVVVNLPSEQTSEAERIEVRDRIIDMLGERCAGWCYDGAGIALRVYFYGIDPKPYIKAWETRTKCRRE